MSCEEAERRLRALERDVEEAQRRRSSLTDEHPDIAQDTGLLALMSELDHARMRWHELRRQHQPRPSGH